MSIICFLFYYFTLWYFSRTFLCCRYTHELCACSFVLPVCPSKIYIFLAESDLLSLVSTAGAQWNSLTFLVVLCCWFLFRSSVLGDIVILTNRAGLTRMNYYGNLELQFNWQTVCFFQQYRRITFNNYIYSYCTHT